MLGILIDAAVIGFIILFLNKGDRVNWGPTIFSAGVITLVSVLCMVFLGRSLGLLAILPVLPVAILAFWMVSGLPLRTASLAGVIFFAFKIGEIFVLSSMMA